MNTKTNNLSIYAGTALMLIAAVPGMASPTAAKPTANIAQLSATVSDVHVANTAAQAIPTVAQGTTLVGGNVKTSQSGAWNVGLIGSPNVTIANSPTVTLAGNPGVKIVNSAISAIPVSMINEGARHTFQKQVWLALDNAGDASGTFVVPAGWKLVIEHINGVGTVATADGLIDFQIDASCDGDGTSTWYRPVACSDKDHYHFIVNEATLVYADPGSTVRLEIQSSGSGDLLKPSGFINVSGHLEK